MTGKNFKYDCVPLKLLNQKRELKKKERDLKKMELENIIITSKQPKYKENETLNFCSYLCVMYMILYQVWLDFLME